MHNTAPARTASIPGRSEAILQGGLLTLALQDALLFAALMAGVAPHPPAAVGPFIGAVMALALRAAWGLRQPGRPAFVLALVAALLHLANFGPHKFFSDQGPVIAPMVVVGLALIVQVAWLAGRSLLGGRTPAGEAAERTTPTAQARS